MLWPLHWRPNGRNSVSNHQPHDCLFNRLFRRRSKETSKLRVTGLCAVNSPGTGEFPAQMASNAVNVSIWWRHHAKGLRQTYWGLNKITDILRVFIFKLISFNIFRVFRSKCYQTVLGKLPDWTGQQITGDKALPIRLMPDFTISRMKIYIHHQGPVSI